MHFMRIFLIPNPKYFTILGSRLLFNSFFVGSYDLPRWHFGIFLSRVSVDRLFNQALIGSLVVNVKF